MMIEIRVLDFIIIFGKGWFRIMCLRRYFAAFFILLGSLANAGVVWGDVIDLSGEWGFQMDPEGIGIDEEWFVEELGGMIRLPGSMAENGLGDDVSVDTEWTGQIVDRSWYTDSKYEKYRKGDSVKVPFWLTPVKHYVGVAWYQKTVEIPESWEGKQIVLFLERCHWETRLWVDEQEMGMRNSLVTPHKYDLSDVLTPGRHRLTLCVDNTVKIDVGINAHSVSDHTQTNWNGVVGRIVLLCGDPVYVDDVQVYPDVGAKTALVRVMIVNDTDTAEEGVLTIRARASHAKREHHVNAKEVRISAAPGRMNMMLAYPMGEDVQLWDEFNPNLYKLTASLKLGEFHNTKSVKFGMREFRTEGTQFAINGRTTFLRGTLECCIFPLTGYPPTDVEGWEKVILACKAHGLNHIRFHSHCPPEAAFIAADRLGFYFQVEGGFWCTVGQKPEVDEFIYKECGRILKEYGNHPSFCLLAYGNEPGGGKQKEFLGKLVNSWKEEDPRRLYTCASGWPIIPENQYHVTPNPRIQAWGAGLKSRINAKPPETMTDYEDFISQYKVPVISHEIGQWCVYPNLKEIEKYTGVTRAYNFEIFRDTLEANHMLDLADEFLMASGKLQTLCYKEDIESALRTEGFGGFELLDLHDFPGQGTALVGVLDPFWESKGYVTAEEYHRFACETVPLARMEKRVWTADERFEALAQIAHFGPKDFIQPEVVWSIEDDRGDRIATGEFPLSSIPTGKLTTLGSIDVSLNGVTRASKCTLSIALTETKYINTWDFWVYPANVHPAPPADILITDSLDDNAQEKLEAGGKVLLIPAADSVNEEKYGRIPQDFRASFGIQPGRGGRNHTRWESSVIRTIQR